MSVKEGPKKTGAVRRPDHKSEEQYLSRTRFASKKSGLDSLSAEPKCWLNV
jgi:hypothetical protein